MFEYTQYDFSYNITEDCLSEFDKQLMKQWLNAYNKDYFRYKLNLKEKIIGRFGLLAQLNEDRGKLRRKPQNIQKMNQNFNPNNFNFNQIPTREEIFDIKRSDSVQKSKIIINASPFAFCHSLVIPSVEACHPQILNQDSIQNILELILISKSLYLRVAFNSLCAFASVNHLHFHIYYLTEKMYLESVKVNHLSGSCYELVEFPSKGFVFQLVENDDISRKIKDVYKVIEYLNNNNIAHNIFITRGEKLNESNSKMNAIRIFLWPRRSEIGSKENDAINPAACELFGHIQIKDKNIFEEITESEIHTLLRDTCEENFYQIRNIIKSLFSE